MLKIKQRTVILLLIFSMIWNSGLSVFAETGDDISGDAEITSQSLMIIDGGTCGAAGSDSLLWNVYDTDNDERADVLEISGTGAMADYEMISNGYQAITSAPWSEYKDEIFKLVIEEGVTYIGENAFNKFDKLKGDLVLPDSLTHIGDAAFYECTGFNGDLILPENLERLEWGVFHGCTGFDGTLKLSKKLTYIGGMAFNECNNITGNIVIPEGVKEIWEVAFGSMYKVTGEVIIPESVEYIDAAVFQYCSGIEKITFMNPDIEFYDYHGLCPQTTVISSYVRSNAHDYASKYDFTFDAIEDWGDGIRAYGECGDDLSWTLSEDGVLKITGTGKMYEYAPQYVGEEYVTNAPWEEYRSEMSALVIEEGVTSIGSYAFCGLTNLSGDLVLADSITEINHSAFYGCTGFDGNLKLSEKLTYIGGMAFYECNNITGNIVIPEGVKEIWEVAFSGMSKITGAVVIPESVEYISGSLFENCNGIEKVTFMNPNTEITEFDYFSKTLVICGYKKSTAYDYAMKYHYKFEVMEENHIWDEDYTVDKEPTCKEEGSKSIHCTECDEVKDVTAIPKSDHTYDDGVITTEPTTTTEGVKTYTCSVCGDTKEEKIPVLEEVYDGVVVSMSIDKKEMSLGEKATITLVMNEGYGAKWISLYKPITKNTVTVSLKETDDGVYTGTFEVDEQTESGIWQVRALTYTDGVVSYLYLYSSTLYDENLYDVMDFSSIDFEVTGTNADVTDPVLVDFSIDKTKVSAGETVKISIKIQEENPESSIRLYYNSPSNTEKNIKLTQVGGGLEYEGYFLVDSNTEMGIWKPDYIYINDTNDNNVIIYNSEFYSYRDDSIDLSALNFKVDVKHNWNDDYTVDKEATCKEEGSKSIHCADCDEVKSVTVIEKTDHSYGEWIVDSESTCISDGSKHKKCSVCENVLTEVIKSEGHAWNEDYTVDKEATCKEEGSKSIHCADCGEVKNVTVIEKADHIYDAWYVVRESTTNIKGLEQRDCTLCDAIESREIDVSCWEKDSKGWRYRLADGSYIMNCWRDDSGARYHFNSNGYMDTGWLKEDNNWYYLGTNGALQKGWIQVGNTWYYGDSQTGSLYENKWLNDTYYFKAGGAMVTGWRLIGKDYYFFAESGKKVTNRWVGNYYLKNDGVMATSEWVDAGKYYVNASGVYQKGWLKLNGGWYYLGTNGALQKGWIQVGNTWYYGDPYTGRLYENKWKDNTYYFKSGGAMATGWTKVDGNWYYLKDSGAMATGWTKVDGSWYYLKDSGVMATGWTKVDGSWYYLKDSGVMVTGWLKKGSNYYYLDESNGKMYADGVYEIDGERYEFDKNGIYLGKAQLISAPTNDYYLPFSFEKNSANGIKLCWMARNQSGKTINYYTVRLYFYNAVGDPAYDEITRMAYKDIKYVGPVLPNADLVIYTNVGYVPTCAKVVLGEIKLEYNDGTEENFWYGYYTTNRR